MAKTAKEVQQILSEVTRKALEKLSKKEYTAKEANERVRGALIQQITELEDRLVKMRQLETGETLDKSEFLSKPPVSQAQRAAMGAAASGDSTLGIPKSVGQDFIAADPGGKLPAHKADPVDNVGPSMGPTPTQQQVLGAVHAKPAMNVFQILKKPAVAAPAQSPLAMAEMELEQPSEKDKHPKSKGAVLPSDKAPKKQDAKDTGSGGQIKKMKKSESPIFKNFVPLSQEDTAKRKAILQSVGPKPVETANKTVSMKGPGSQPMQKAGLPRLGGKDVVSQHMTTHAFTDAAKQVKNAQMPAAQKQTTGLPKMPSMAEHQSRADMFADFMPKPGKFGKDELMKDIEAIDKAMSSCK